jgi:hypothetical protein
MPESRAIAKYILAAQPGDVSTQVCWVVAGSKNLVILASNTDGSIQSMSWVNCSVVWKHQELFYDAIKDLSKGFRTRGPAGSSGEKGIAREQVFPIQETHAPFSMSWRGEHL